jgi:hypothetical protein
VWWTFARIHLGAWFLTGDSALGPPFAGWAHALIPHGRNADQTSRYATAAGLAVLLTAFALVATRALRRRGPLDLSYLALAAIAVCLATNATNATTTALRNTAFLLALVPFVITPPVNPQATARNRLRPLERARRDVVRPV